MSSDANTPTPVLNSVIDTFETCVANALHSITAECAAAARFIALAHIHWVRCVSEVEASSHLACLKRADLVARRNWETKTCCRHGFWHSFKCDSWMAIGKPEEGGHSTSKGMPSHPYLGVRVEGGDIVV